jgi:membrane protein DedA with SNARE-associated domain
MLYGGALASGALTHSVDILGWHTTGFTAYLAVVAAGVLGYQIGAIIGWWIGERGGRPFLERHGRLVHLTHERLERAERWFERWNDWAVLVGRVTPIARSFISIPAGVFGMPFKRYNVLTLIGNTAWCAVIAGIGYGLGSSYESFNHGFKYVEYAVVLLIVAAVGYLVLRRRRATVSR